MGKITEKSCCCYRYYGNSARAEKQLYTDAWKQENQVNLTLMRLRLRKYIWSKWCDCTPLAKSDIYDCVSVHITCGHGSVLL